MTPKNCFTIAAILGAIGIAFGAFGAHGLPGVLVSLGQSEAIAEQRMQLFETAVRYQMYAALALLGFALANEQWPSKTWWWAQLMLLVGAVVFCGVLYGLVFFEGPLRAVLGMTAPVGGALMIGGWIAAALASRKVDANRTVRSA